jgi:hypothetical protein
MKTLADVRRRAAELGCIVEEDKCGNTHECRVRVPDGKRFVCSELHEFVDCTNKPWKPDYADLLDRLADGIEDCPDPECDWCNSELYPARTNRAPQETT